MKYAHLILVAMFLTTSFVLSTFANPITDLGRTIILINGTPFLVDMDENARDIKPIVSVPHYFDSPESHLAMISRISEDYNAELPNMVSRLLIFEVEQAMLDHISVDHIRDLARLYSKGYINSINITVGHTASHEAEALAANRINVVYQMLRDFGVQDEAISADMKIYKSDIPNQFVRLNIK